MSFAAAGHSRLVAALLFGIVCAAWVESSRAATLHVDASGILTGASDVVVNGRVYDVAFVEGSCASLYFPCLFESALAFSTAADAEAAAQALLDQVFLDVAAGPFDTQPALTNGCSELNACSAFVPYGLFVEEHAVTVFTRTAHNSSEAPGNFLDVTGGNTLDANFNTINRAESVWAVFTSRQLFVVPEASSAILLFTSSVALGFATRRARRRRPDVPRLGEGGRRSGRLERRPAVALTQATSGLLDQSSRPLAQRARQTDAVVGNQSP